MTTDWGPGDASRPRHFCRACGVVEYTPLPHQTRADFPPSVSMRKALKRCAKGPKCEVEYRAGVSAALRRIADDD